MPNAPRTRSSYRRWLLPLATVVGLLAALVLWSLPHLSHDPRSAAGDTTEQHPPGPPWRYGQADARFTVIEYADLECPYCQAYAPVLRKWIDQHPDVSLQWHHLPLPMHEPMATRLARLAECVGEAQGHAGFWKAVTWIYQHTRSDGQGLPAGLDYPDQDQVVQACLASERPDVIIRAQADEARQAGVMATPTLRLLDHKSGQSLIVAGPAEGDTLLSALDLLAATDATRPTTELSADDVSDMPR
ncbi:thioredoxin domain-containing protein [Achromobacter pestifer]|uniref:Thioredoxin domain-containing protein n=1 Tax=Achromobacter pestifer TaxID=1353889 RepID=A0A6S6YYI9_9BURK|nr:thioredoxin domain-containing protein [Achromobacter pestifer]CAB3647763.1 hypothetical protein LMG3431_02597 [Achromobacter pestifer]